MADLTEINRKHFDDVASSHQNNFETLIAQAIYELQVRRHWISPKWVDTITDKDLHDGIRLLDYACGSGTASKALAPFVTSTIGIDLSANMVTEYNNTAREMGLFPERMRGYQCDLLSGDLDPKVGLPDGVLEKFDIIVIGMALHHVSDPGALLEKLKELLKPGGVVVVLDMVPDQVPSVPEHDLEGLESQQLNSLKTIGKHGFTENEMREFYESAGISAAFEYVVIKEEFRLRLFGREVRVTGFIARGQLTE
ncbi:class I SAM-dependent methyltransferase [Aspergillus undulatus]|uniref:class I SAM-dependent methyltransferase n=1 Tax=Aspergillus undulatus TaxID=1810928 RepID=UPI003CCE221D